MANEKFKINGVVSEVVPIVGTTGDVLKKTVSGVEWGELAKATQAQDGLLSKEDFDKLQGIQAGAEKNNVTSTDIVNLTTSLNNKVDKETGKGLSSNDYTTTEKNKLNGIEAGAQKNNVTSTDISNWNNKVDKVSGKQLSTNDYTTTEKNKLEGIQAGAQVNAVTSVNGQTGAVTTPNTTYDAATTTTNGLMSSADKTKLDGIETGYAKLTGATFTGKISSPIVSATRYFETPTLVGEGDDSKYFHRVVFGHKNFDKMEFHEYGGLFSFLENKKGGANDGRLLFQINTSDVDSKVPLKENGVRVYSPNNKPTAADLGITKSDVGLGNVDNIKQMPISGGVLENYSEKLVTVSASGGNINLSLGNVFQHTPSGNITYSISNAVNGQAHSFTLIINMGSTVRTLTFPSGVKWQGGKIPNMSTVNKTYVLTFMTVNGGTNWLGMFGGEF